MTVGVTTSVTREAHQKLTALAKGREMPLQNLCASILNWAGDQDVQTLLRLGVRLPVYPGEFESGTSKK